jgi:hypothetical protein
MHSFSKYARRLKKYASPVFQFNPHLLAAKSSARLLFKRHTKYHPYTYPLLVTSGLQRSGTHLVDNLLRNHPGFLAIMVSCKFENPTSTTGLI